MDQNKRGAFESRGTVRIPTEQSGLEEYILENPEDKDDIKDYDMEYVITILDGNKRKIISRHTTLQEALEAGKIVWTNAPKGVTVSCVDGTVNEAGELIGKYQLYKSWF